MLMQAKLLRFLEGLRFMRVGGTTKIQANVRLIFATLRPLDQEVRAGRFRGDLFYRIQGITVLVPPLRDRRADIAPLLSQFLAQLAARHGVQLPTFSRQAKAMLLRYNWPGNVRELRNVVETLCVLRAGRQSRAADLPECVRSQPGPERQVASAERGAELTLNLDNGLESLTRQIVEAALDLEGGNKIRAAARLQVSPRTMQRYLTTGRVRVPS